MEWLNYHHLLYFWLVVREGGVAQAAARLRLAHPTVSEQVRAFQESLGETLLEKKGRKLVLTEMGRVVYRYADEIFSLGRELQDTLKGRPTGKPLRLVVGVADAVPKMIARRLLKPAGQLPEPVRLVCREGKPERLLAELSTHALDLVLADAPVGPGSPVRAFNHLLGECPVTFMAVRALAQSCRRGFPRSLHGAPLLMPADNTALRRSLEQWLDSQSIRPHVVGEFEDSALLMSFAQDGDGVCAVPSVIEEDARRHHGLEVVGTTDALKERYFAISVERRLKHPAVVAISTAARGGLFA